MRHLLAFTAAGALTLAAIITAHANPVSGQTILAANNSHAAQNHMAGDAVTAGDLEITSGWVRAMLPGQKAGGGYLSITNKGTATDRLIGVSSAATGKVEIHTMEMVNDVMTMRPVEGGLEIPAGATVELKPGGYHIMFMGVSEPFAEGSHVPVMLQFETAGEVGLVLPVRLVTGSGHGQDHGKHGNDGHGSHDKKD